MPEKPRFILKQYAQHTTSELLLLFYHHTLWILLLCSMIIIQHFSSIVVALFELLTLINLVCIILSSHLPPLARCVKVSRHFCKSWNPQRRESHQNQLVQSPPSSSCFSSSIPPSTIKGFTLPLCLIFILSTLCYLPVWQRAFIFDLQLKNRCHTWTTTK